MATGTVKYFNTTKGFGFITPEGGGADVFVHATAVELAGMSALAEGQRVSFDVETDQKGSKAVRLKRFSEGGDVAASSDGAAASSPQAAASNLDLTIYHNPECETSRNTLTALRMAGHEPRIVEYLKTPPTKTELRTLAQNMKLSVRDVVRKLEPLYAELGLDGDSVDDETLLDAMVKNPVLINRPIVASSNAARMCRPSSAVKSFLSEISGP
jgi:arsenate reductase (glutaredoxin)